MPISRWIAVVGGCGYVPVAPGTAGSMAGVLLFLAIAWLADLAGMGRGGPLSLAASVLFYAVVGGALLGLGIWAAGCAEADFGRKDDGRIVIDELVGQLVTLWPLLLFTRTGDGQAGVFFSIGGGVVTGFVLFRVFDVWKPGAVRWAERRFEGGLGVMADDVVAGLHGAVVLVVLIGLEWLLLRTRFGELIATLSGEAVFSRLPGIGGLA